MFTINESKIEFHICIVYEFSVWVWLKRDSTCPKPNQMTFRNPQNWFKSVPSPKWPLVCDPRSKGLNKLIFKNVPKLFLIASSNETVFIWALAMGQTKIIMSNQ